ncbi:nuclear transport factor 2 family protein [Pseudooceanicola sp.]|uniref:nuclear transport factor 2 family protein n=1 Tax=Pseudooceanicola sp. TaxID=1914328 RepID=UPI0035193098
MTQDDLAAQVTELMDREKIRDCIFRYCRGIDRADEATLRSAYWPEAHDSHGTYSGPIEGFYEWVKSIWATGPRNIHAVSNVLIEFRDDTHAAVESYFNALQRGTGPDGMTRQVLLSGRYCDYFEKRVDEWRVLDRTVVFDWIEPQTPPEGSEEERFGTRLPVGGTVDDDPVYRIGLA